jgi:ribosomal protein S12 methylthiotransferase
MSYWESDWPLPQKLRLFKIAEGCDRLQFFMRSVDARQARFSNHWKISKAEGLARDGVKELIAQDLTYYGLDIYKKRNLAELLELAKVEGIEWIRSRFRGCIGCVTWKKEPCLTI